MSTDRIVVAGSSGLIGTALVSSLRADGIDVTTLVRRAPRDENEIEWQPDRLQLDPAALAGARAVVNLCGASIGKLPWTRGYRAQLASSRLRPTRTIAATLRSLGPDAPAFVSASAVGFYGDRPGERLTETSEAGDTFLATLSADWEHEALQAGPAARVALLRTAPLLHPRGVLKPLMLLTKLGVSGPLGRGDQVWPWITLEDEVRAIRHIINEGITGPVNLSGPEHAMANDIGRGLARRLRRPFFLPAPAWALRLGLGADAADSLLLSDAIVAPDVLLTTGFRFMHGTLDEALDAATP
ncbi:TIGR01777 family oxidoreductase [Microbacterium amylolyticum]|uniref:Uncharacterized protein (TIGR01777 family) n=1 Tax=Microbacterium amylolyticum TaxID=936337 RepID=A0ABS4ZFK5_9MICO|nr:TIGR01777 family oxidoreductase [Microbacterium amylolyticum]MBP2436055.1 uncharacterized protein (TIGR01777 family) [Microbacterium amylolyticum]